MSGSRGKRVLGAVAALLAVLGAVMVTFGLGTMTATPAPAVDLPTVSPATRAPSASPSAAAAKASSSAGPDGRRPAGPTPAVTTAPRLTESAPQRVRIEAAGVDAATVKLGIADDGTLETPKDPDQVGWFTGRHTPGGPGVAVLAGHVTWNGRKTVFFNLGQLARGSTIVVDREDGSTATFAVTRRSTFAKDEFPSREVYRATSTPELVLITCGGEYDAERGYYDANVIVWAELVSLRRS